MGYAIIIFCAVTLILGYFLIVGTRALDETAEIDTKLVQYWDNYWYAYAARVGRNPDPRLLGKRKNKMLHYKDKFAFQHVPFDPSAQALSYIWRRTFRVFDPYVSLNDTQKWMLGVKEPYRPDALSRVLIARKPSKTAIDAAYHQWIEQGTTGGPFRSVSAVALYDNLYRRAIWKSGSTA